MTFCLASALSGCDKASTASPPATKTAAGNGTGTSSGSDLKTSADDDPTLAQPVPVTGGDKDPKTGALRTTDPCNKLQRDHDVSIFTKSECEDDDEAGFYGWFTPLPNPEEAEACAIVRYGTAAAAKMMGSCACRDGVPINNKMIVPSTYHCDGDVIMPRKTR